MYAGQPETVEIMKDIYARETAGGYRPGQTWYQATFANGARHSRFVCSYREAYKALWPLHKFHGDIVAVTKR